ncbi:mitochondrial 54S ribosomal protein bL31m KNAG_0B01370 [Huiozyma naganishii CBS 8797]|uniref:Ribosomal protein bL31m N-terminal domain-containing protein n=1 Tax=Huiozyma naganishii (strain ATCC MYA-139 / BCRC 22969 / CBS 8797 / KCTC 17520 / NBRC 10181 / NCYC 3082 / Yp74L-3) TaxID=1071383 RepID=J7S393_HUIN7|nr:hypothetical protein KNAG_0B01370 [Kazachstania naganishii CBS 8797]CCK68584.1 hypothetical protein KNAG_0B01370 [Kazachstania naganishii CBS 8797]
MFKGNVSLIARVRHASTGGYPGAMKTAIPRRPVRKIPIGKARPAIYHQFDVAVEMSDGSVVMRRSQFPKAELRLIQDQRNNPLWNTSRSDLVVVDANAAGSIGKFKQKYGTMFASPVEEPPAQKAAPQEINKLRQPPTPDAPAPETEQEPAPAALEDYLDILDDSTQQIKTGKLASKRRPKKK